jgi:hypothetical protein
MIQIQVIPALLLQVETMPLQAVTQVAVIPAQVILVQVILVLLLRVETMPLRAVIMPEMALQVAIVAAQANQAVTQVEVEKRNPL